MGSYTDGHNTCRPQQIEKGTTMQNQNRNAALARPAMKLLGASTSLRGLSGGAKVLGKLPVPGRPTNVDYSRARAYCACGKCGWGLFGHFFSHLSLLFSFSLSLGDGPI